jgi:hypothetical protein
MFNRYPGKSKTFLQDFNDMKNLLLLLFIFVFSFASFGQDAPETATFTVTNLNDSGAGSLRQAIADAGVVAGDDTINFQSGLSGAITLTSGELLINSNIAINGIPSITVTRSTATETPNFRILNIASGVSASISNLTISGGKLTNVDAQGGGIYNAGILSLSNTTVSNNFVNSSPSKGGGIYNTGSIFITNSNLSNNSARCFRGTGCPPVPDPYNASGGGIYNTGSASFTNSSINDNIVGCDNNGCTNAISVAEGGGITNTGTITLTNSIVSNNQSLGSTCTLICQGDSHGGGIFNTGTGSLNILNSSIRNNLASGTRSYGGGIYGGNFVITNSTVSYNSAEPTFGSSASVSAGGGIFGGGTIINTTVSNNKSSASNRQYGDKGGGGIYGSGIIRNSTISGNSFICYSGCDSVDYPGDASRYSGGIKGFFTISNTIVAMNGYDISGGVTSEGHNLIGNVGSSSGWVSSDLLNQDPRLAPLANNGGPTQTQALLLGSLAINAGNNADAPSTDQRGFARIMGGTIDIGAFESDTPACIYTPSATSAGFGAAASGGTFTISANGGCAWSAVSNNDWITVNLGASWSGSGTVGYLIAANSGSARIGTITVAGLTYTISQAAFVSPTPTPTPTPQPTPTPSPTPACTYALGASAQTFIYTGGSGLIDIITQSGCAWTATSSDSFVTLQNSSGTGNGTVSFDVAANSGAARQATITIQGQIFTVTQSGGKTRKRVRFF